jgi:hypothetical protein
MAAPYGRIVVLHVVLIGGGFLMQALDAPAAVVLLLVAFKLWHELRALRRPGPGAGATDASGG